MEEIWRQIRDFEGYEVSTLGRVRSWWRTGRACRVARTEPKLLTPSKGGKSSAYLRVTIRIEGKAHTVRVHQAVTEAFCGSRPPGTWALHKDGDQFNNRFDNLYWGTPVQNARDRAAHGRTMLGKANHKTKLAPADVITIRSEYAAKSANQVQLAMRFGVSQASISAVIRGKVWRGAQ